MAQCSKMFVDSFKYFKRKDVFPDLSTVIDPDNAQFEVVYIDRPNFTKKPTIDRLIFDFLGKI